MKTRSTVFTIIAALSLATTAAALDGRAASTKPRATQGRACRVIGIVPTGEFLVPRERRCFQKSRAARRAGYTKFDPQQVTQTSVPSGLGKKNQQCSFVGVKASSLFFPARRTTCFRSEDKAAAKGFVALGTIIGSVTPVPTPSATAIPGTTPTAGPTPTPDPSGTNFSFLLGPTEEGSGFEAQCTATVNGLQTSIFVQCASNVPNIFEVHMHPVPENSKFCVLATPPSNFSYSCPLTPLQAQSILSGNTILSIHLALGADNQAAAGFIRNP